MNREAEVIAKKHERRMDDMRLIEMEGAWPLWPYLPMKKHLGGGRFPEVGFLFASRSLSLIYKVGYDQISQYKKEEDMPKQEYPNVAAMLDDGWTVD